MPNLKNAILPIKIQMVYEKGLSKRKQNRLYKKTVDASKYLTNMFPELGLLFVEREDWVSPTKKEMLSVLEKALQKHTKNMNVIKLFGLLSHELFPNPNHFNEEDVLEAKRILYDSNFAEEAQKKLISLLCNVLYKRMKESYLKRFDFFLFFSENNVAYITKYPKNSICPLFKRTAVINIQAKNSKKVILHELSYLLGAKLSEEKSSIMNRDQLSKSRRICFLSEETNAIRSTLNQMIKNRS